MKYLPEVGATVYGTVQQRGAADFVVELHWGATARVPLVEFEDVDVAVPEPGTVADVVVTGIIDADAQVVAATYVPLRLLMEGDDAIRTAYDDKEPIKGVVVERIKGGFLINLSNVRAFLPMSHASSRRWVADVGKLEKEIVGTEMEFAVIKCDQRRGNYVVSRRELVLARQESFSSELMRASPFLERQATVIAVTPTEVVVDLGPVHGVLAEVLDGIQVGQQIGVCVDHWDWDDDGLLHCGVRLSASEEHHRWEAEQAKAKSDAENGTENGPLSPDQ